MAIKDTSEADLVEVMQSSLSPSSPIRRLDFLMGREDQVDQIRKAFYSPGRQVFIYGDRGVGKSSLALTAAHWLSAEDEPPTLVVCDKGSSFYTIIRDIGNALLNLSPAHPGKNTSKGAKLGVGALSASIQSSLEQKLVPDLTSMNEAVAVVRYCVSLQHAEPVIVVDEFDQISSREDERLFAGFIKQLGDQSVPAKFFFTGVGDSLSDLLSAHESCYRNLAGVHLDRLGWDGRLRIMNRAATMLNIRIDKSTQYRIAAISDGFPHYVHHIAEKLIWEIFEDEAVVATSRARHFTGAIRRGTEDIQEHLRVAYEKATHKYQPDYQEVLWAVADHHELKRRSTDIYQSYLEIMRQRDTDPLTRERFNQRMYSLKKATFGNILSGSRTGWYHFQEPWIRGYVRLIAEREGVHLAQDHPEEQGARPHQVVYKSRST